MNDYVDPPQGDEDPVESLVMAWGLPGFVIGLALACVFFLYIANRIASFFYPGA